MASTLDPSCAVDGGIATRCAQDSDCMDGSNGRCLVGGPFACESSCSYDQCSSDSDCPGDVPCQCRASASDVAANTCVTGSNCLVDADCGPGGYCSPSQVGAWCGCPATALCPSTTHCYAGSAEVPCACGDGCGHGYFCHTPNDTCTDDSDCSSGTCNYDSLDQLWSCSICWPVL